MPVKDETVLIYWRTSCLVNVGMLHRCGLIVGAIFPSAEVEALPGVGIFLGLQLAVESEAATVGILCVPVVYRKARAFPEGVLFARTVPHRKYRPKTCKDDEKCSKHNERLTLFHGLVLLDRDITQPDERRTFSFADWRKRIHRFL